MRDPTPKEAGLWSAGIAIAWAVVSVPSVFIGPALDDWVTSAPIAPFSWSHLAPRFFWRPFEVALRLVAGQWPPLYPALPTAAAILGHALAAVMVYKLSSLVCRSKETAAIAATLFTIAPACTAAIWSLDGSGEVWSTALGLVSAWLLLRWNSPYWLLMAGLATLWKESGIAWFLAAPLLTCVLRPPRSNGQPGFPWNALLKGAGGMAVYFAVRYALQSGVSFPESGRYALELNPLAWLRNAAQLTGVSATTVDTLALLGPSRNLVLAGFTAVLGLPLLAVVMVRLVRGWTTVQLVCGASVLALLVLPHLPQPHVSELYAYPLVAALVVLAASAGGWKPAHRVTVAALLLFAAGSLVVDSHKALAMIETSVSADAIGHSIARRVPQPPSTVCLVRPLADEKSGYSVFTGTPGSAAGWGRAAHAHWGWRRAIQFVEVNAPPDCPSTVDVIVSVSPSGDIEVHRPKVESDRPAP